MERFKPILILIALSYLFFMLGNGIIDLTSPDEVFYSQTAKEMAEQKTWMVPYLFGEPQFEKPILTYWLLRISAIPFGFSNFGMRFFPALFAIIGIITVYLIGLCGWGERRKAFICALILASSGLYIGLARTVFTDMIFTIFILLSLASFFWAFVNADRKKAGIVLFFIFSALAVLTKGPLGFLIPISSILLFLLIKRDLKFLFCGSFAWGFLIFAAIAIPWYVFMIKEFGNAFIHEFFYNDHIRRIFEAEHRMNDSWYFYPASMVFCMFPWSIFVVVSFVYLFRRIREKEAPPVYPFVASWIIATFLIFQFAHSKLVSYIFPLFPALAIIAGDFIHSKIINPGKRQFFILSLISWFMLLSLPAGLLVSAVIYPDYMPSRAALYTFISLYAVLLMGILVFIIKRKFLIYVYFLSFVIFLFLAGSLSARDNLNIYLSSRKACRYLLDNYKVDYTILCSKPFVRGVRFFTDKDVAVFDQGGTNFFSPHPIAYLNSNPKVIRFLETQPVTYCVLNKSSLSNLQELVNNQFRVRLLKTVGNEYIVKVQETSVVP